MAEKKDNSGTMSINDRREKPTHPHWRGQCVIGGKEYWISGWDTDGRNGPFISMSFTPKEDRPAVAPRREPPPTSKGNNNFDDDIPF